MEKRLTITHHTDHHRLNENLRKKEKKSKTKNLNRNQKLLMNVHVIGLLQYQHPSVRVCYRCGVELKPRGMIPESPHDLIIISGDKRSYYDATIKAMKQNQHVSNVYFHLNPNCVTVRHQFFIPGLVRVPEDLVPFLDEEHKHILRQVVFPAL